MKSAILVMLRNYLSGRIALERFEDWFLASTWDANRTEAEDTVRLVRRIKLRLAEFLNGDWSEEELRANLSTLIVQIQVYRIVSPTGSWSVEVTTQSTSHQIPVVRRLVLA